ncbi:MAG: hypothetical protein H7070_01800 [Saprospiraceae bacterium]|nr:hypothetical protein [Pyrinomonadaceae bacterium]
MVGDANGADKSIQQFLYQIQYENVIVYHVDDAFRNNVGHWKTQHIKCDAKKKDFHFYAFKDAAMSKEANYGFMLWDGRSKGTINNAVNLLRQDKKVLIFHSKNRKFVSLKVIDDLRNLLQEVASEEKEKLITDLKIKEFYGELSQRYLSYT